MNDDHSYDTPGSCNGGYCPGFLSKLPMNRKVMVVAGGLVAVLAFLASVTYWTGFEWLLVALGAAMIYGGYTGHCMLTWCMNKYCCNKNESVVVTRETVVVTPADRDPDDNIL